MKAAKEASAALLAGESVGFYSEFPWDGELPEGLVLCGKAGRPSAAADPEKGEIAGEAPETGIAVTIHRGCLPFKKYSPCGAARCSSGNGLPQGKGCSLHPEGGRGMSEGNQMFTEKHWELLPVLI